ncbi:response regulator receiver [Desulfurispirillum indicum S5]|uniref:Response regulator receiver n=1 Tax=Desulfurispirillum indicum (strain ATCC BAA-1389 / DSM 22839 / S5) TaxID=653733 RepID=E6W346_DESIS|nr:response regulator [Desulfurispirillum indicum]ADU65707.1 response regulator receiver [Desulfurispirillum indicum S5]
MVTPNMLKKYTDKLGVLYAEDNSTVLKMTRDFLAKFFNQVEVARNGQEALDKYNPQKHDIVIMDINMPAMNGIELTRRILEINPDQAIFITSAHNDSDYLFNLIALGVTSYMMKPLNNEVLTLNLFKAAKKISRDREVREVLNFIEHNGEIEKNMQVIGDVVNSLKDIATWKQPTPQSIGAPLRNSVNSLEQVKSKLSQLRSIVALGR